MKPASGYTLIEILVALSIIAMLFALGYVNFRDFSRRQVVADAGKTLQGDVRLAQQLALSGQKPDDIKCNIPNILNSYDFSISSSTSYQILADCTGGNVITKSVTLPTGISISIPSPNPIQFKVLAEGTNMLSGSSVVLKLSQSRTTNTFSVTISSGGQIQ